MSTPIKIDCSPNIGLSGATFSVRRFSDWLSAHGASVLLPISSRGELIRFVGKSSVSTICSKKGGELDFSGDAQAAYDAFVSGRSWRAFEPTPRRHCAQLLETIIARDGSNCFFCNKTVARQNASIEHLVAVAHGGPNHISNMYLAHATCNSAHGHMSACEKIKVHVISQLGSKRVAKPAAPIVKPKIVVNPLAGAQKSKTIQTKRSGVEFAAN